jgi:hypothetical protein
MRVNTEIFQRSAAAFGFNDAQFRHSDREMIEHYVDEKAARMQGITMETFLTRDYARLDEGTPHDRVPHKNGNYPTPPGKCKFVQQSRAVNRSTQCRVTWRRKTLHKRTQSLHRGFRSTSSCQGAMVL